MLAAAAADDTRDGATVHCCSVNDDHDHQESGVKNSTITGLMIRSTRQQRIRHLR